MRKAARYAIDNPEEIAFRSLRDVATRAGVAHATFSRLARAARCESYGAFQDRVRRDLSRSWGFADRARDIQAEAHIGFKRLSGHAAACVRNIETLNARDLNDRLRHAAETLLEARRVVVAGAMGSFSLASFAHYMANLAMPNWMLLQLQGGDIAGALANLEPDDAMLVIGFAPYARTSVRIAREGKARGCRVVAMTDAASSPLARPADVALVVPTETPHFFPSQVTAVLTVEALIAEMIAASGDEAPERLRDLEENRRSLGEYWAENDEKAEKRR